MSGGRKRASQVSLPGVAEAVSRGVMGQIDFEEVEDFQYGFGGKEDHGQPEP